MLWRGVILFLPAMDKVFHASTETFRWQGTPTLSLGVGYLGFGQLTPSLYAGLIPVINGGPEG